MKRVYVAGAYSADNVMDIFKNIRKGMRMSTKVFLAGYAPFCPWLDYQYILMLREGEFLSLEHFYEYGLAWLEVSDAVLVLPDSENSVGTQEEIAEAALHNIPVYYKIEDLKK